ncbi:MAG: hypothetical protein ABJB74_10500 [Gemmatimonas sp.]
MPAATAQALAVGSRNVFGILSDKEKEDVRKLKLDDVIKRFTNKRAKDFNTGSLKEYGRRTKKAIELFTAWRADPTNLNVKTRVTQTRATSRPPTYLAEARADDAPSAYAQPNAEHAEWTGNAYQTTLPVRAGHLITISNIPTDLTKAEADKLAGLIRMLAIE